MEKYDYYDAVTEAVAMIALENKDELRAMERDEAAEWLNDRCWSDDSVTGNGSGSYTFSAWQAEEYICHNLDLYQETCEEWGMPAKWPCAEEIDVAIRCYVLRECVDIALNSVNIWD